MVSRQWVKLSAGLALGSLLLAGLALLAVRAPSTTAGVAPPPPVDTPPVSALSAPGTSPPEPEPEPGPPPPTSPGRCSQEALALYRQLRPREALALIERGAELWPASDDVGLVRARLLAAHGRWDEAARAYRELRERSVVLDEQDPWGEEYRAFTVERILAVHGERAPEAPPGFSLLLGGSWELDPAGVFRASQGGIGTFQLSALMRDEAPALPARVGVELRLDSQSRGPEVRAYAGLLLGGRALDDFLCLFLLRDAGDPFSRQVIERQGLRPGQPGYPPTVLRLTHQRGTEWRFLANELLPPGAREWTALEAELRGQRLVVRVDGRQALDGELPRDLEGQVGLLKFYVDQVEMRAFRCEPLGGQPSIR